MTPAEKIAFVNKHRSADYFEKDAELFRKLFPSSRMNNELFRANQFNKVNLDGRILMQILSVVCGDTVLENRGIVKDGKEGIPAWDVLINTFKKADLDKVFYQGLKSLVKELGIETNDQKKDTLLAALKAKQKELTEGAEESTKASTDDAKDTGEKKSVDQG